MQVNRRDAIKVLSLGSAAVLATPWSVLGGDESATSPVPGHYPYRLPELPHPYDAWAACIDPETMEIHHTRHHAAYVNNLNKALEEYPEWHPVELPELLARLDELPETIRTTVRNNGGGHANHALFWDILNPEADTRPEGKLAGLMVEQFGSIDAVLDQLRKSALSVFGSGWAWLSIAEGRLVVEATPNQDSPLMTGHIPLLGLDVWEHAYYLRYQYRRADYVNAVLNHIRWPAVESRLV